jgi:serine/threonine protein kinase
MDVSSHGFNILSIASDIPLIGKRQIIDGEQWFFLNRSLFKHEGQDTLIGYTVGVLHDSGTYGKIFKARRMVLVRRPDKTYTTVIPSEEIVVKRVIPETETSLLKSEVTSHASEAYLHVLSWQTMQKTVVPWSIPRPYEIYGEMVGNLWASMSFGMSYVEGVILQEYLTKNWCKDREINSRMFKEIIGQTAFILHKLQANLSLNHRDLKVNNLIVRVGKPVVLTIDSCKLYTGLEVTLIDFGFACLGDCSGTLFQAGSWFPFSDICYKKGRDLAQLIYCINCFFPLEHYLTPEFYEVVKGLMQTRWSGGTVNCLAGISKDGTPVQGCPCYDTGIYEFLRREEVDPILCEPTNVFRVMCG